MDVNGCLRTIGICTLVNPLWPVNPREETVIKPQGGAPLSFKLVYEAHQL